MKLRIAALVLSVIALLVMAWAPDADADAGSYLAYIHNNGISTGGASDAWALDNGNRACTLLRQGMTVDQISGGISFADKRGLTLAAQHKLCPDTIR